MKATKQNAKKVVKIIEQPVKTVLLAMAFAKTERERVDAYILPIFNSYDFRDEQGNKIDNENDLYLCKDEKLVNHYFEACDKAHRNHGFIGAKGVCPALTAESLVIEAERALVECANKIFKVEWNDLFRNGMKDYKEYIDLLIKMTISANPSLEMGL